MKKSNPMSPRTAARGFIHQTVACGAALFEGSLEVGNPIADVMNAGTVAVEKPGDGSVGRGGRQELDVGFTQRQGNYPGSVDIFNRSRLDPEHGAIESKRFVEVGDGNPDVGQTRLRRLGH